MQIECPECNGELHGEEWCRGLSVQCPLCRTIFVIPGDKNEDENDIKSCLRIVGLFVLWMVATVLTLIGSFFLPIGIFLMILGLILWVASLILFISLIVEIRSNSKLRKIKSEWKAKRTMIGDWLFLENGQSTKNRAETISMLSDIFETPILIDTNIWMGESDEFWKDVLAICKKRRQKISVPSAVHDEIVRLKRGDDEDKAYWARVALRRLLEFSNNKCVDIVDMKKSSDPGAYADPEIITLCEKLIGKKHGVSASIITNDSDLIIRARQILNKGDNERCRILSVDLTEFSEPILLEECDLSY